MKNPTVLLLLPAVRANPTAGGSKPVWGKKYKEFINLYKKRGDAGP